MQHAPVTVARSASLHRGVAIVAALLTAGPASADVRDFAQADLTFSINRGIASGGGQLLGGVAPLSDLDGDGWADFATSLWVFPATAPFGPGRVWVVSSRTGAVLRTLDGNPSVSGTHDRFGALIASPGDINGDGAHDFVVRGTLPTRLDAFDPVTGALLWTTPVDGASPATPLSAVGDLDNDGVRDIACAEATTPARTRLFSGATGAQIDAMTNMKYLRHAGRIDGDAVDDLVGQTSFSGSAPALISGATRSFIRSLPYPQLANTPASIGDISGDGTPDFAAFSFYAAVYTASGATGAILRSVPLPFPITYVLALDLTIAAGDVDGDSVPDIATSLFWSTTTGDYSGVAIFSGRTGALIRICRSLSPTVLAAQSLPVAADFNSDGTPDLLFRTVRFGDGVTTTDVDSTLLFLGAQPCPTDANYDRVNDFLDLNLLLSQYGQSGAAPFGLDADINHDTNVDMLDLNLLLSAFGSACPN